MLPTNNRGPIDKRKGANLPHWTADRAIYFVTFRLADSLPQPVVARYKKERSLLLAAYHDEHRRDADATLQFTAGDVQRLAKLFSERIEKYLDAGAGSCWMKRPEIAELVQNAIFFFDQKRYELHAWCVMPNHVHVVFRPMIDFDLSGILHSWKSFTAKGANKFLNRTGEFWQAESYDHLIRDQQDYNHCVKYALDNPACAGLINWRWVGTSAEHRRDADAT